MVWGDGGVPPLDRTYLSSLSPLERGKFLVMERVLLNHAGVCSSCLGPSQPFPVLPERFLIVAKEIKKWIIFLLIQVKISMDYPYLPIHPWLDYPGPPQDICALWDRVWPVKKADVSCGTRSWSCRELISLCPAAPQPSCRHLGSPSSDDANTRWDALSKHLWKRAAQIRDSTFLRSN